MLTARPIDCEIVRKAKQRLAKNQPQPATSSDKVEAVKPTEDSVQSHHHVFGSPLAEKDFATLERCGIPRQRAEQLPWRRVDHFTGAEMFGRNGSSGDYAGILIVGFWPGNDKPYSYRLRRDHPDLEMKSDGTEKEKAKYVTAPGDGNKLYFACNTRPEWLEDSTLKIIITEGEKKCEALWHLAWLGLGDAADRPRFLPVAVSGIWGFRAIVAKQDGPNGERQDIKGVIPDFDRIAWQGREVIILFDANVRSNDDVRIARFTLAKELRARGEKVLFADLPAECGVNGIDDYIGKFGSEKAMAIIAGAYDPKKKKAQKTDANGPLTTDIDAIPSVRTLATKEVKFVIPSLIPEGTVTVISGLSEAGKTTLVVWLCNAVACGGELFGEQCEQHPVLFLTKENPVTYINDITNRLKVEDGAGTGLIFWGDWLEESPPAPASSHIQSWVSQCEISPVVIVDSVMAFFDGDNENDSAQMRAFLNQGRKLLKAGAVAVIFLHHPGKSETSQDYRGSSDLKPAIDTGYKVTNTGEGKLDHLYLKAFKARFAKQRREMVLIYTHDHNGDRDVFISDEKPTAVAETNEMILRNLLERNPGIATGEFEKAAMAKGVTQVRARQYLETGVKCGTILLEVGRNNKKSHRLAARAPTSITVQ